MDKEEQKKAIYDRLSARRKRFIDKIGYEKWDPFQEPNHPFEIRTERTFRTAKDLIRDFLYTKSEEEYSAAYRQGVYDCCIGIFNADERYKGMFEFCLWYKQELEKRNIDPEQIWER